jgi:hypothetical protein
MVTNDAARETIAGFGRKYLWWEPVGGQPHSEERIIAQTMNLGTYDDILVLEQTVGKSRLVENHAARRTGLDQRPLLGILARPAVFCDGSGDPGQGSAEIVSEEVSGT